MKKENENLREEKRELIEFIGKMERRVKENERERNEEVGREREVEEWRRRAEEREEELEKERREVVRLRNALEKMKLVQRSV